MNAPSADPTTEPYPPVNSAPPTTAVMIASNSLFVPLFTFALPFRPSTINDHRAADAAVAMNSRILTRATGTPTYRAAWAEPPTAKIQLPNRVRSSTHEATATTRSHHTSSTLKLPVSILNSVVE